MNKSALPTCFFVQGGTVYIASSSLGNGYDSGSCKARVMECRCGQ